MDRHRSKSETKIFTQVGSANRPNHSKFTIMNLNHKKIKVPITSLPYIPTLHPSTPYCLLVM